MTLHTNINIVKTVHFHSVYICRKILFDNGDRLSRLGRAATYSFWLMKGE